MITMHPDAALLSQFAAGDLPASLSTAIAIHLEFCAHCRQQVDTFTDQLSEQAWEEAEWPDMTHDDALFTSMIEQITADHEQMTPEPTLDVEIEVAGNCYTLPRALHTVSMSGWQRLGSLSRCRLDFNEGNVHSNMLYIAPGGAVPHHSHKGYELTVLLSGSFSDEQGEYHAGDFILLDEHDHHAPITHEGCLCMTVANDAMRFTQGVERLFNPLINYLY